MSPWAQVGADPLDKLLTPQNLTLVGVLAIIIFAMIRGWIVPVALLKAERDAAAERLKSEIERTRLERERAEKWERWAWELKQTNTKAVELGKDLAQLMRNDQPPAH